MLAEWPCFPRNCWIQSLCSVHMNSNPPKKIHLPRQISEFMTQELCEKMPMGFLLYLSYQRTAIGLTYCALIKKGSWNILALCCILLTWWMQTSISLVKTSQFQKPVWRAKNWQQMILGIKEMDGAGELTKCCLKDIQAMWSKFTSHSPYQAALVSSCQGASVAVPANASLTIVSNGMAPD